MFARANSRKTHARGIKKEWETDRERERERGGGVGARGSEGKERNRNCIESHTREGVFVSRRWTDSADGEPARRSESNGNPRELTGSRAQ